MAVVRSQEIIDSWSVLIENAKGKAESIFKGTEGFITKSKAPNVSMKRKKISPGIFRGLAGAKRDFLVVVENGNRRLKPFQMFIGARDYGNSLDVSWYLTFRPSSWQKLLVFWLRIPILNWLALPFALGGGMRSFLKEGKAGLDLDLFDEQDLRAYVTTAHHCLLKAVDELMEKLHQDPSKIERKSRGFLGIS
ncbi:MAG TPA: hypothetical protein ACFYD2_06880 [Candidatus Avalokitesvara rifleensis]|uniref:hypothetical protein n=1 Tax=Candidatus Avalokitesvara rifleensis TaxID=3367620 RepID=UPI00271321B2|nr:hypothetical protein [Candidatus Brocadiales bacterium]